jgi:pyridoxine 5'-phosphate synthase PdxJ
LHLIDNDYIRNLDTIESQHLLIKSADVLKKIRNDDPSWVNMVPEKVVNIITERGLFQKPMS